MHWISLALLSALFSGSYHFFVKMTSGNIHQIVGAVILQAVALMSGILCLVILQWKGVSLNVTGKGVQYALLAGLGASASEIIALYMFAKGIPASIGIPVIIAGAVTVGVLFGIVFLRETLTVLHTFAILLVVAGVAILSRKTA